MMMGGQMMGGPMMGSPMMAMAAQAVQAVNPMMSMMGQFFGGNTVNMNVRLNRQVFFPGNVVEGVVELTVAQPTPVVSVNLILEGHEAAVVQHIDRVPDGFIDHPDGRREQKYREVISMRERSQPVFRQVVTLCGFYVPGQEDNDCGMLSGLFGGANMPNRATVTLPPGVWSYPFRLQLPQQLPPTYLHGIDFQNLFDRRDRQHNPFRNKHEFGCGVAYWVMGFVDLPQGGDVTRRTPIMVVNMVPQSQYQNPCAVSRDQHFDLSCCCCISKGSCDAKIGLSRTLIALDRDQITITADVDNTKGEAKLNALHCSLTSRLTATVPGEGTKMTSKSAGNTSLSLGLEPGKQKSVQGTMNLDASAVPTFRGAFTQSEYNITMVLDVDWASDEGVSFPVYVVQSVDPTNQFGMQFNASGPGYNAGMFAPQQYYYQPPQGAAGFNPAPCGPPPPTAVMLPPPQQMNTNMPPPMFQPL